MYVFLQEWIFQFSKFFIYPLYHNPVLGNLLNNDYICIYSSKYSRINSGICFVITTLKYLFGIRLGSLKKQTKRIYLFISANIYVNVYEYIRGYDIRLYLFWIFEKKKKSKTNSLRIYSYSFNIINLLFDIRLIAKNHYLWEH